FIDDPSRLDIMKLKSKAAAVHMEFMFARSMYETPDMIQQHMILTDVAGLVDEGLIRTTLGEDYGPINAANLRRAHAAIEGGRTIGKIVLTGFPELPGEENEVEAAIGKELAQLRSE
ncbi:MAG: zinc-binding dehydrogenase, partial [Rhizobiales bacterium]|nr:zinc-binding dehydrogenase [Hyphomicrobiales bacterium]